MQAVQTGNDIFYRPHIDGKTYAKSMIMEQQNKPKEQPKIDKAELEKKIADKEKTVSDKKIINK